MFYLGICYVQKLRTIRFNMQILIFHHQQHLQLCCFLTWSMTVRDNKTEGNLHFQMTWIILGSGTLLLPHALFKTDTKFNPFLFFIARNMNVKALFLIKHHMIFYSLLLLSSGLNQSSQVNTFSLHLSLAFKVHKYIFMLIHMLKHINSVYRFTLGIMSQVDVFVPRTWKGPCKH